MFKLHIQEVRGGIQTHRQEECNNCGSLPTRPAGNQHETTYGKNNALSNKKNDISWERMQFFVTCTVSSQSRIMDLWAGKIYQAFPDCKMYCVGPQSPGVIFNSSPVLALCVGSAFSYCVLCVSITRAGQSYRKHRYNLLTPAQEFGRGWRCY